MEVKPEINDNLLNLKIRNARFTDFDFLSNNMKKNIVKFDLITDFK